MNLLLGDFELFFLVDGDSNTKILHCSWAFHTVDFFYQLCSEYFRLPFVKFEVPLLLQVSEFIDDAYYLMKRVRHHQHIICKRQQVTSLSNLFQLGRRVDSFFKVNVENTGDNTDPCGSPKSTLICCSPTWIVDCLCSLVMSSMRNFSPSFLHLFCSSYQSISRSTESYAFCRSIRRLNFLFLLPCTSLSSRAAWIAVDFPSLKPV